MPIIAWHADFIFFYLRLLFMQLFLGDTNRAISATPMNEASTRSHCIFSLHLQSRKVRATQAYK